MIVPSIIIPERRIWWQDALSRKERLNLLTSSEDLIKEFEQLEIEVRIPESTKEMIYVMIFQPELLEKIKRCQEEVMSQDRCDLTGEEKCSQKDDKGILRISSRIWIPHVTELKKEILHDAHNNQYSIHPRSTKMYRDLKSKFMMAKYERRNCRLGQQMFHLPESQS